MSAYPVTFECDFAPERSRLTTFFRLLLVIPHLTWGFLYNIAASVAVVVAWFAIVFTAKYPAGLYEFVAGFTRWFAQVSGYFLLLTDEYPPFLGNVEDGYPIRMRFAGPLPSYSRAKTFFRFILAIPIMVLRYVMTLLLEIGAVGAWFVIVITGRQPRGLQEVLELGLSYTARSDAYLWLLTETYPPFQDSSDRLGAPSAGALPATPPPPGGSALPEVPEGRPRSGPQSPAG